MASVKTNITELPECRVRVQAEVPADEVERRIQTAAKELGRQLRIPGFRKGKVPPPVVLRRLGRKAVFDEALRDSLGSWYVDAIDVSGIAPVGDPDLDVGELPDEGEPLAFSIEIGVRPRAKLGDYKGLEVGRREPHVEDALIDEEVDRLRERLGKLETVQRPAAREDHVVIDYVGKVEGEQPFPGGEGRDQLVELGSGRLVPGFEEQLTGAAAGDRREVRVTFPDEYPDELSGKEVSFDVSVKEVKAKRLPELDDAFASEAGGFDTLAELREDIATRLKEIDSRSADSEYEQAVVDAVVAGSEIEVPDRLVHARAHEFVQQTFTALARQGLSKEAYLSMSGKSEEELAHEAEPDAAAGLRREAVLVAIVEAEQIAPSEEELLESLKPAAEKGGDDVTPETVLEGLRSTGRLERLREDVATNQALALLIAETKPIALEQPTLIEAAEPVGLEQATAPELWTPESGGEGAQGGSEKIWTPER